MSSKIGQNQFAGGGSGNGSLYGNIEKNPFYALRFLFFSKKNYMLNLSFFFFK